MNRIYKIKNPTKAIQRALKMPRLKHEPDPRNSPVVQWLIQQRDVLQSLYDHFKDKGVIIYDKNTGTWKGRDL